MRSAALANPGELRARFNLRYSPVQKLEGLKASVEEVLRRHAVRYTLEWFLSGEPFYTPPGVLSQGERVRARCGH